MTLEFVRYLSATLGTILLVAAAAKVGDSKGLAGFLADIGVPSRAVGLLAKVVPVVEGAFAVVLLVGLVAPAIVVAATALTLVFVLVQGAEQVRRGTDGRCRCFGRLDTNQPSGIPLVRAFFVAGLAVALAAIVLVERASVPGFVGSHHLGATLIGALSGIAAVVAFSIASQVAAFEHWRNTLGDADATVGGAA